MNTLVSPSFANLIGALALAVLYGGGSLRYRDLGKRIAAGECHLGGIRLRCLLWTWFFGIAAVGFVFVNFLSYPLRTSDYAIVASGALVGVCYVWVFDAARDKTLKRLSALPFRSDSRSAVFLSYKSDDAPLVRFIAEQMVARGQSVWFNEYCVILGSWDEAFEVPLRDGVASATSAVFFTNSKWAMSRWCTDVEAKPLLTRLQKNACLEVRIPSEPTPHAKVPDLATVPRIDAPDEDRWVLLWRVSEALRLDSVGTSTGRAAPHPLRGQVNGVNYELNIEGWTVKGRAMTGLGNLMLPHLQRMRDGILMSVNVVVGKVEWERRELNAADDREVFRNLRSLAKRYFEHTPLAGRCVGVHLVWHGGLSHGAFTYWGGTGWCRKYDIVLPARDGGADIAFTFTCAVYGDFASFCRFAWLFDDLVASLKYGTI